jgi:hypothetical protein
VTLRPRLRVTYKAGTPHAGVEPGVMEDHEHHSRTARLLETRLDALAQACERSSSPQGRFGEQVFRVAGATRNAVALELLSAEEAGAIWAEVRTRHPSADWCRLDADLAA